MGSEGTFFLYLIVKDIIGGSTVALAYFVGVCIIVAALWWKYSRGNTHPD